MFIAWWFNDFSHPFLVPRAQENVVDNFSSACCSEPSKIQKQNSSANFRLKTATNFHLWHLSFGITSTSTSCKTFGTVVAPCLILPHPATVANFPINFADGGGRQTGKMCCLNFTFRFSFTNAISFWKSLGE